MSKNTHIRLVPRHNCSVLPQELTRCRVQTLSGICSAKGSRTFEWKLGRKLAKVTEGALECRYDYDHTGNRVKKTVTEGGTTVSTVYRMAGDLLLSEKTGAETIWYEYDSGADLISMKLNGTRYFYIRNVQNDIVGLTEPNGTVVVRYEYNA